MIDIAKTAILLANTFSEFDRQENKTVVDNNRCIKFCADDVVGPVFESVRIEVKRVEHLVNVAFRRARLIVFGAITI